MNALSERYVIRGGSEGRERLRVLSRVLAPGTLALLESAGVRPGMACLDVGCGGGDVAFELGRLVGAEGRVLGLDLDPVQLEIARREAAALGLAHCAFELGDAMLIEGAREYDIAYARFLLTHLPDPAAALARMHAQVVPGGTVVLEDIDFRGHFCEPPCAAFDRYVAWYTRVVQGRGADPWIGARLPSLLREAGFADVRVRVVQPCGLEGDVKRMASLTLANIADAVHAAGLAEREELARTQAELDRYADDPGSLMSLPRIVQAWATRAR
jgi:2-polyprenyl-3-methyl-5-hydroxy-6-metoxy-1,4-benzoquinol methylase